MVNFLIIFFAFSQFCKAQKKVLEFQCGENVYYSFDDQTIILNINGIGPMYNFDSTNSSFINYKNTVTHVIIEEGVTSIGSYAFYYFSRLKSVFIAGNLTSINKSAFIAKIDFISFFVIKNRYTKNQKPNRDVAIK
ncbi:hypothetical protein M9Y10_031524 [Tritrichomonas musculus]|uniref:Uncharacterized protein n=1 Tax=Tritrichomonas musculus TaxID=1915356 RepID=A0ABR2H0V0_9EUKA